MARVKVSNHYTCQRLLRKLVFRLFSTTLLLFGFFQPVFNVPKNLSLPNPSLCAERKIHFRMGTNGFYASWLEKDTRNLFLNWLDARNWCRDRCMDTISMETSDEIKTVKLLMKQANVKYVWTSGRLCDFKGCDDREDLKPLSINGWFWSGSGAKLRPTNEKSELNDWSYTGALKVPQPDSREKKKGYEESCLAVLNNYYNDGIKWHDVGCHHIKSFVCEESPSLIQYARRINTNPNLDI